MSELLNRIRKCVENGSFRISNHGYDELANDGLFVKEIVVTFATAEVLEEYPDYPKGPCILVLGITPSGISYHAVWGIPKGVDEPAVLITAYRPDSLRWSADFRRRKK